MKRIILLICCILTWTHIAAQEGQISATFNYSTFYRPEANQPYLETYLSIDAWTCRFVPTGDGYQAAVEVLIVVRQGDSAIYAKRYTLNSPVAQDSTATDFNFLDLQRFSLPNGIYHLDLSLRDANSTDEAVSTSIPIELNFEPKKPSMSSIQLMVSATPTTTVNMLSRGGYDMEPYCNNFIPANIDRINFYYEVYNIQEEVGKHGIVTYAYIEDAATGQRMGDASVVLRDEPNTLIPHYSTLDISQLGSGNYMLKVEVRDRKNELLMYTRRSFFRAANSTIETGSSGDMIHNFATAIDDEELLRNYLDALYPIATDEEKATAAEMNRRNNLEEKQYFLYYFWMRRDEQHAEQLWNDYRARIDYVDKNFAYPRTPGHRTDRGRVYLQYGPPDYIRDEKNFVGALHLGSGSEQMGYGTGHVYYLPYQLWRYNKLDHDDANRVFLFWDELRSGFYKLLVSNARGEIWDKFWERRLSQQQLDDNEVGEVGEQFKRGY